MIAVIGLLLQTPSRVIPFGPFDFNREIKIGDFLTPISLIVTVLAFVWTLRKDIMTRQSAEADKVRAAAAKALGKLQRWKELAIWFYRDIQPIFVETSDLLAKNFDVSSARDHLWTALATTHVKSSERFLNEGLETTYVELSSYYPGVYDAFSATVATMKEINEGRYGDLLQIGQNAILALNGRKNGYAPPILGNSLRGVANVVTTVLTDQLNTAAKPVEEFLISVIKQNDHDLLDRKKNLIIVPGPPQESFKTVSEVVGAREKTAGQV